MNILDPAEQRARPRPGGDDHDLPFELAVIGPDEHPIPGGFDPEDLGLFPDLDARPCGDADLGRHRSFRQTHRRVGLEQHALEAIERDGREPVGGLPRGEPAMLDPARRERRPAVVRRRARIQAAGPDQQLLTGVLLEHSPPVERSPGQANVVQMGIGDAEDPRGPVRGPPRVSRPVALQEDGSNPPAPQRSGRGGAHDAPADDHDVRSLHRSEDASPMPVGILGVEASECLVDSPVFKTGVRARARRRVRFPSASACFA